MTKEEKKPKAGKRFLTPREVVVNYYKGNFWEKWYKWYNEK